MRKALIRLSLILLTLVVLAPLCAWLAFRLANRTNGEMTSGGLERRYLLYVPASYDPLKPTPLVLSIHGWASWPAQQAQLSRWNELADEHGFIVVYPSGTDFPMRWLAYGSSAEETDPQQDLVFIDDLIDKLSSEYTIDPRRIYANGMSNGGGMTFFLSCQLSERIAAFGMVSGAYLLSWEECHPARPASLILFHGTEDPIVPFQGGPSEAFDIPFPAIPAWLGTLTEARGCPGKPEALPSHGAASAVRYNPCSQDTEIVFYTISGGGHTWPGGGSLPERLTGANTDDVDASRLMWEFFQRHPLSP